jgi:hypothetical protein
MSAPANSGRTFDGWIAGAQTYGAGATYPVSTDVTFRAAWKGLNSVGEVADYLSNSSGSEPIPVPVDITGSGDTWEALLAALQAAGKYVTLDLSQSTLTGMMTAGEFDPGNYNTGERYIVSLTLPAAAQGVKGGTSSSTATFKNFTALKSISGVNIETMGNYAFYGCTELSSINLPAATTIGTNAFYDCDGLGSVNLPAAISIGDGAFYGCGALSAVRLPVASSIGSNSFRDSGLESVDFPEALSIGENAFFNCTRLRSVNLPKATSIGSRAFQYSNSLSTVSFPAVTSMGVNVFWISGLSTVDLPKVTSIPGNTFFQCGNLRTVNLPAVTSITSNAFDSCGNLTSITIKGGCTVDADMRGFKSYYDGLGMLGGTYTYVGSTWTGPN